jgi:hypothetical protein
MAAVTPSSAPRPYQTPSLRSRTSRSLPVSSDRSASTPACWPPASPALTTAALMYAARIAPFSRSSISDVLTS